MGSNQGKRFHRTVKKNAHLHICIASFHPCRHSFHGDTIKYFQKYKVPEFSENPSVSYLNAQYLKSIVILKMFSLTMAHLLISSKVDRLISQSLQCVRVRVNTKLHIAAKLFYIYYLLCIPSKCLHSRNVT